MPPSYARVNYGVRPAKHVERRMIFDALRRLDRLADLTFYRYVGFGSPYFVDFRLAHRDLGIKAMTNVEREDADEDRFIFNRPFGSIDLEFGDAGDVIDDIDWSQRAIVWLDFDGPLTTSIVATAQRVASLVLSGSVLLVTVNAHPIKPIESRIQEMKDNLGELMPFDLTDPDLLGGWSTADLYRQILHEAVSNEITTRNLGVPEAAAVRYRQWFNFRYADNARMLTTGGIVFDAGLEAQVDGLGMTAFPFVCDGDAPFTIKVPSLTLREMAHLESKFPCAPTESGLDFLSAEDVEEYQRMYRYFPRYADVDV